MCARSVHPLRTILLTWAAALLFALLGGAGTAAAQSACPTGQFRAEYFNNVSLSGTPLFTRCEPAINYNWGNGGPGISGLSTDNYSIRWTGRFTFAAGSQTFTTQSDDGVRLYVDGIQLIDRWTDHAPMTDSATRAMTAGDHDVKVEYYEHGGGALIQVAWTACPTGQYWAEYFNNVSLSGTPLFGRCEPAINYNWGNGGPGSGLPTDNYSVRWTGRFNFAGGTQTFTTQSDDGVRLYVDGGAALINRWTDHAPMTDTATRSMTAGIHEVKVEYYEHGGGALIQVAWTGGAPAPPAPPPPPPPPPVVNGIVVSPGQDLAALANSNPEGATFVLRAGIHRGHRVFPKKGQSFIGDPGAVLSGAQLLTAFGLSGALWTATAQTKAEVGTGECDDGTTLCTLPEDLFIDDRVLQRVGSVGAVRAGTWYYDYGQKKAYFADDPTGHRVEMSVVAGAFLGNVADVTIRNLIIEKYANRAQVGAVNANYANQPGTNWLVEDNEIRWNHGAGIVIAHGMRALNNTIHGHGQVGIVGAGDNVLIEGNEIAYNNMAGYHHGWESGGTKFSLTRNLVVRGNLVHHNYGNGLWTDVDNIDTLYESNEVRDNEDAGIFHEISYRATIRNNTVSRNGFGYHPWLWGAGIQVAGSRDVEVYGNILVDNANGIAALQQNRGTGLYGPRQVVNLYVHDNQITQHGGAAAGLVQDVSDTSCFTSRNNRFNANVYRGLNYNYAWMNQWVLAASWRAYGLDLSGRWE